MYILKNKEFHKWALQEKIKDKVLVKAIQEMHHGLYEANLGGSVFDILSGINAGDSIHVAVPRV